MDDTHNKRIGTAIIVFVMGLALAELLGVGVVTPSLSIALLGTATTLLIGVAGANQLRGARQNRASETTTDLGPDNER